MSDIQSSQTTHTLKSEAQDRVAEARVLHQQNIAASFNDIKQSPTLRLFIVNDEYEINGDVAMVTAPMAIGNLLDSMVLLDDYNVIVQTEANNLYAISKICGINGSTAIMDIFKINPDSKNSTYPEPNPILPLVTGVEFLNTLKENGYVSLELELTNSAELWGKVESDEALVTLFDSMNTRFIAIHNTPVRRNVGADNYHEFMIMDSDDEELIIDVNGQSTTFKYFETTDDVFAKLVDDINDGKEYMDDPDINSFCIGESIWIIYDEDKNRFAVAID